MYEASAKEGKIMVLVLKNEQIEGLVPMDEEIEVIEQAFRELGEGTAKNAPRARLRVPWKEEGGQYYFNDVFGGYSSLPSCHHG